MQMTAETLTYRIDNGDVITRVGENWPSVARENGWGDGIESERVVGRPLWEYIQGLETRHLYREIFSRVRSGKRPVAIPFRCDSPGERRFLELFLRPLSGGRIDLESVLVRRERREPVALLDLQAPRSGEILSMCSMCKKIAVSGTEWVEVEEALSRQRIFEADEMPGLSHGLCPACCEAAMDGLDEPGAPGG